MELDELEENNRKRLAEAILQKFELLDGVSKVQMLGTQWEKKRLSRSGSTPHSI